MTAETLHISPIYTAMARPPMLLGITLDYFAVILAISVIAFNCFGMSYALLYLPLHLFGNVVCLIDPNYFKILVKKIECRFSPNVTVWGCKSYAPF